MQTERSNCTGSVNIAIEFDILSFRFNKFCFGFHTIPIAYYEPRGFNKQRINPVELDRWDPVLIQSTSIHMTPTFGSFVQPDIKINSKIRFQIMIQKYSIWLEDYKGEDRKNAKNISDVYYKENVNDGLNLRYDNR
jgi:hypothetical protein